MRRLGMITKQGKELVNCFLRVLQCFSAPLIDVRHTEDEIHLAISSRLFAEPKISNTQTEKKNPKTKA